LYLSHTHREALASLEYGFFSNRGFTAMIAPPGMGKTTLLFRFLESIRETARTVFLFDIDAQCEPSEFVGYILRDIGITPGPCRSEMHEQLNIALVKETRAGRKFVVVIDEAQNLSDAVLERVRLLSNFETSRGKLMQIVLSGQPQLADKLMRPSLLQLRQRISTICRLEPLSAEETIAYIDYRLKQAGYEGERLFTEDARKLITETSHGIPRTINNLCFNALSLCQALKSKQVDGSMVSEVIADLQLIKEPDRPIVTANNVAAEHPDEAREEKHIRGPLKLWGAAAAMLIIICVLGVLGFTELRSLHTRKSGDDRSLNLKAPSVQVPETAADTGQAVADGPAPTSTSFAITVEPDQRLQDIAVQYMGGFSLQRLHQIQALNPKLTDPDHIEAGQKIWLPGRSSVAVTRNGMPPASTRKLP
jgi:type II secretory pathway predicted ATPase ExeA